MTKQRGSRPFKMNAVRPRTLTRFRGAFAMWVQLPASVVEARAGVIPAIDLDTAPPPPSLSAKQMRQWYRGLPVLYRGTQHAPFQVRPLTTPEGAERQTVHLPWPSP